MEKSAPPRSQVDLVDSFARQVGGQVEIVLAEPKLEIAEGDVLVLRKGRARHVTDHEVIADDRGRRVVLRIARDALDDGVYAVRLRTSEGATSWGCRLLVQGDRPLVLLWGEQSPRSELPVPHPRGGTAAPVRTAARRARGLASRAAAAGRRRISR